MVHPKWIIRSRLALRFLQFAASLVVIVAFFSAYTGTSSTKSPSVVESNDLMLAMLMNFLGMVYGLFFLVFVEILGLCTRPLLLCEQVMDFFMVVLLLIASIVLVASNTFLHCRAYRPKLRCHDINAGVIFTLVSLAAFGATLVLSFFVDRDRGGYDQALYGEALPLSRKYDPAPEAAATPNTAFSPPVKV